MNNLIIELIMFAPVFLLGAWLFWKQIGAWFGEYWYLKDEYCPHCGDYCTGKSAFCTKHPDGPGKLDK